MATTTNYGWTTPDDTALVKDGAAAIRTLGTSIDTTTKALNPSTTLGDIEYRSSTANTNTRLAIGTAGQVLTVNSGANAPEWATISAGGMTLLSTTTLSGTSTTVSSISGSYTDLLVIINNPYVNSTDAFRIKPNNTADISMAMTMAGGNTEPFVGSELYGNQNFKLPIVSTANSSYQYYIRQYSQTTYGKAYTFGGVIGANQNSSIFSAGTIFTTSAITSLVFTTLNGTSTYSGGQVLIYGVK
jgi:hypothetical protein